MPDKKKSWIKYLTVAVAIAAAYFINTEVQTRLGQSVLDEMQLERHSLPEALAKAKVENKLVLADMSAIWCPTCRSLDKNVFSNPKVQAKINENYVFARIEYESEEGESFMDTYDVRAFPTILILDPTGKRLKKIEYTSSPEEFNSFL
ncbi:thioredoxin family protein [Pelagicoccus sp. SDUM812002]|uniref:thioredoxin family protein n=1 Tax=Pelagicoccus sp. SDUM812002 TaxID=3041266 RepID=UPI00280CDD46|nr:thioredoxin family protein [Pelagicoccus sp. SDUM812002]MDQ8185478.1 thioredoxin family protein [Pelagicoccus sp. SDUM812002]